MINFYRKLRKKMADDNRPLKYLRYAIGEIVLVVIGILIAVQINGWNKNKQLKQENKIFLTKMITELELNKNRMFMLSELGYIGRNLSLENAVANCDSLLRLTYIGLNISNLDFILNSNFSAGASKLNLHKGVYEELINTGKLYTIGSDDLVTDIKNYYKRIKRESEYNAVNNNMMRKGLYLIDFGLNKMRLDYRMDSINFDITNYPWYFNSSSSHYQNLQIGIKYMLGSQRQNLYKMKEIIRYSDSLIFSIKKELKSTH